MKIVGVTVGTPMPRANYEQTDPKKSDYIKGKEKLDAKISKMQDDIAYLQYLSIGAIEITSITNNVGTVEMGTVVKSISIEWKTNRPPVAMTFDGEVLTPPSDGQTDFGWVSNMENITADRTWTVTATDERGAEDSASTTVKFLNGVYYGVLEDGAVIDSDAVLSLTRELRSNRTKTFTATAGETQRFAYAIPARYGTPAFKDVETGFQADFYKACTIAFTNGSRYTENYDVWLSTHIIPKKKTFSVS